MKRLWMSAVLVGMLAGQAAWGQPPGSSSTPSGGSDWHIKKASPGTKPAPKAAPAPPPKPAAPKTPKAVNWEPPANWQDIHGKAAVNATKGAGNSTKGAGNTTDGK